MWRLRRLALKLYNFCRPAPAEQELTKEVAAHLGVLEDEFRRRGMTADAARLAARRSFGGVDQAKERSREERSFVRLEDARRDAILAFRALRRAPGFTVTAMITLGLGIGSVTVLFAVSSAVFQPITDDDDRIVRVWEHDTAVDDQIPYPLSYPEFLVWGEQAQGFEALAAILSGDVVATGVLIDEAAVLALYTPVSSTIFSVLGAEAQYGRPLQPTDDVVGAELVAVLSHGFWQRISGGDPSLVGQTLRLTDGNQIVVVGVASPDFDYPLGTDMWLPLAPLFDTGLLPGDDGGIDDPSYIRLHALGRLARGVSPGNAEAELTVIHTRLSEAFPDDYPPRRVTVQLLADSVVGGIRPTLVFLSVAAGLVFLMAGVNVAALMLMQAEARRKETALRVALGATRGRLLRQTATEALLLGVLAGASGLLVTHAVLPVLGLIARGDRWSVPRIEQVGVDARVLGFCILSVLVWVLILGTVPSWGRRPVSIEAVLRHGTKTSRGRQTVLRSLATTQIALTVMVVTGAALLTQSFGNLRAIDRGFNPDNVAVLGLPLPEAHYPTSETRLAFYDQLIQRVEALPDVVSAAPSHLVPGTGNRGFRSRLVFEGQTPDDAAMNPMASLEIAWPSHFRTLGIPIVQGRGFTEADTRDAMRVAIVSESTATRYWPGERALGKRLHIGGDAPWATVVGVAGDLRYQELTRDWLAVYFPAPQAFAFFPSALMVRTGSDPDSLATALRSVVRAVEPRAPLGEFTTMRALADRELVRPRLALLVSMAFGIVTLVLAIVGVYGTVSFETAQRTVEMAIRAALGASPGSLRRAIIGRGLWFSGIGVITGLAGSVVVARLLAALLFDVPPTDVMTLLSVAAGLLAVVLATCLLPAERAARTDPVETLRVG